MKSLMDRWHRLISAVSLETRLSSAMVFVIALALMAWPLEHMSKNWAWVTYPMLFLGGIYLRSSIQSALWENTETTVRKFMAAKSGETVSFRTGHDKQITITFGHREVEKLPSEVPPE